MFGHDKNIESMMPRKLLFLIIMLSSFLSNWGDAERRDGE
jgi:hypothetical protein